MAHVCPGFGHNGQIDLTAGPAAPPQYAGEYGVTLAAAVYRDLVIVGSSSPTTAAPGWRRAKSAPSMTKTGALRWTFHPLPDRCAGRRRQHLVAHRRRRRARPGVPADGQRRALTTSAGCERAGRRRRLRELGRRPARRDRRASRGTSRPCTTTSGTTTSRRRRCSFQGSTGRPSPSGRRRATCSCSIGCRASRCFRSRNARSRRATSR